MHILECYIMPKKTPHGELDLINSNTLSGNNYELQQLGICNFSAIFILPEMVAIVAL